MAKKSILLVGGGKIGECISALFAETDDYELTVVDRDEKLLAGIAPMVKETRVLDAADPLKLAAVAKGKFAVLSAAPFFLTPAIANAAKQAGAHYFDLTEDVASTRMVKALAEGANTAFIPQCGLAPGFISIVAHDLTRGFDSLRDVQMRVGALPIYPTNALKYNLTWSTDGLINEYCNPCEAIIDGQMRETLPLEEIERFSLDGLEYEAFNTSGGLGTLCETLAGKVENLNYKTVRYIGHRDIMKMLLRDLRLAQRRDLLKDVLETAVPITKQDVVLVFVTVAGVRNGHLDQTTFARKLYSREIGGRHFSAIQITTASGICAMVDLLATGKLPNKGLVRQEQASLAAFQENRFGANYLKAAA